MGRPVYNPLSRLRSSTRGPVLSPPRSYWSQRCYPGSLAESENCINLYSLYKYEESKGSIFFIKVQAIINIFAANFTLILVLMPFSFSLPLSFSVKYTTKCRLRVDAIKAA